MSLAHETLYVDCKCSDFGHVFRFVFDPNDGELWLETHLSVEQSLWKRIVAAVRHVFARPRCYYGNYDVTLMKPEDLPALRLMLDKAMDLEAHQKGTEKPVLLG